MTNREIRAQASPISGPNWIRISLSLVVIALLAYIPSILSWWIVLPRFAGIALDLLFGFAGFILTLGLYRCLLDRWQRKDAPDWNLLCCLQDGKVMLWAAVWRVLCYLGLLLISASPSLLLYLPRFNSIAIFWLLMIFLLATVVISIWLSLRLFLVPYLLAGGLPGNPLKLIATSFRLTRGRGGQIFCMMFSLYWWVILLLVIVFAITDQSSSIFSLVASPNGRNFFILGAELVLCFLLPYYHCAMAGLAQFLLHAPPLVLTQADAQGESDEPYNPYDV